MNISEIVFNNNNAKLEDLVPIKEFQTNEDLENKLGSNLSNLQMTDTENNSMNIFLTEKEFCEKYKWLNINMNNVYYNKKTFMFSNSVIYLDISHFILFDLSNCLFLGEDSNILPKNGVSGIIKNLEEKFDNHDYLSLFLPIPDSFKLEMLEKLIISKEIIDEELYSTFMDYYVTTDFGFSSISNNSITKLLNSKSEKLKAETKEKLSKLPDKVVIYRGQADKSTNYKQAYSWSLKPTIATFFSLRFIEKGGKIVSGIVDKKDIIEYFDNEEQEVLILPNKVKKVKVYDFYSMKTINNKTEDIIDIFGNYKYMLNNHLDFEHDDLEHGKLHSLRVLLHALTLGKLKGLNDYDLHLLAMTSIYHDIGRTNNEIDDLHGLRSRELFERSEFGDNDIVKFLIEYHCIEDNIALEALNNSNIEDKVRVKRLFSIFKDADALDRLRFGMKDLDFTYLRNKEAIRMMLFAHFAVKSLKL